MNDNEMTNKISLTAIVFGVAALTVAPAVASTIAQIKAEGVHNNAFVTDVVITNLVHTDPDRFPTSRAFQVADDTGAITVVADPGSINTLLGSFAVGDHISFTARDNQPVNGLFEMNPYSAAPATAVLNPTTLKTAAPMSVVASDFANGSPTAEALESQRVYLSGAFFTYSGPTNPGTAFAAGTYPLSGISQVRARVGTNAIAQSLGTVPDFARGQVTLVGIFSQYSAASNAGYELNITSIAEPGDTNFDTQVNFDDLLVVAQHYGTVTGQKWTNGDFTNDAKVDFDDLLLLAQHYDGSALADVTGDTHFQSDWALATTLAPEPGLLAAIVPILFSNRRVRRVDVLRSDRR